MPSPSSTRLERALELFVEHQRSGGDWQLLLAQHPDLADVLGSFLEEPADAPTDAKHLGDFRLLREVGRGGVGTVHEARQSSLGRRVALKVLHQAFTTNPTALVRFRREAQTLARLDHPGIVRVFAAGEDQGQHWLAMEFVEGQSLAAQLDHLRASGGHRGESLRRMVVLIADVAEALQHAHEADIVHRDVKPSNILLRPDGTAVLGDFGLARDTEAPTLTQSGMVAGTPHYMAPEQALGRTADCDARTDVWALGATLYECLTLRHAFEGTTSQQVLQWVLTRDPIDPRRLHRGLPVDLAAITQKALEKAPAARYQTAQAFADDLRAFLELRPVRARPHSRTRRLLRLARRQPLVGALVMLGLVSLVLGIVLLSQLPDLRAAAAARLDSEFESAVIAGNLARTGADAEACYSHLQQALALQPNHPHAVISLCLALLKFAGPQAALLEFDRRIGPGAATADLGHCRAVLLRRLQRTDEAKAIEQQLGPPTTSMALWLTATSLKSDFATVLALNSLDAKGKQTLREASRMLSLAVRIAPRPLLILNAELANAQALLDDPAALRESAETLVHLWPDNAMALHIAGLCMTKLDPPRALALLERAVALGLDNPLGMINLSIAQALCGHRDEALKTLEAAMWHNGQSDLGRAHIVETVHKIGNEDLEGQLCETWLQRVPASFPARRAMAIYASMHAETDRAVELLQQCTAANPGDYTLQWEFAMAQLNADDANGARQTLDRLMLEQPERAGADPRLHDLRLDVLNALQDDPAVLAELRRWATAQDSDAAAWSDLATAELALPGADAAPQALAAAERADYLAQGKNAAYLELRARALDRLDRGAEAARVRERAAALAKPATAR